MKWVSVKERLPENDESVLIYFKDEFREYIYTGSFTEGSCDYCERKTCFIETYGNNIFHFPYVTYWAVIPEPPKDDK